MFQFLTIGRAARAVAVLGAVLLLAACSARPGGADLGVGSVALGGAAPGTSQDFVVNVGDRIFFETDSVTFTSAAVSTLNRQIQWLRQYPQYTFTIEGHADERGTREYNIALGARRATAVRDYFVAQGIAANRMRTISYGKERPVAVCNDISCWSQNRRSVTVLNASS